MVPRFLDAIVAECERLKRKEGFDDDKAVKEGCWSEVKGTRLSRMGWGGCRRVRVMDSNS
jgi:hypothetical protein